MTSKDYELIARVLRDARLDGPEATKATVAFARALRAERVDAQERAGQRPGTPRTLMDFNTSRFITAAMPHLSHKVAKELAAEVNADVDRVRGALAEQGAAS